ncbi:MAG: hypothetical protein CMJ49_07690 [Planctomycetaceae bacterium]|nr:hypothetical protein [Planctomycetaceae bacterium]
MRMPHSLSQFDRFLDRVDAGGWALLVAGLAAIGVALLVPAATDLDLLRRESAMLQAQVHALQTTRQTVQAFTESVNAGEPALMRRLAWRQLHLKPAGTRFLHAGDAAEPFIDRQPVFVCPPGALPAIPTSLDKAHPPDSHLQQLTGGPHRIYFLCGGVLLAMLGLLSALRTHHD